MSDRVRPPRLVLAGLLALGLVLELVLPLALADGEAHEHGVGPAAADHVHLVDHRPAESSAGGCGGDRYHEAPHLELAEHVHHAPCALCARVGKTSALVVPGVAVVAHLEGASRSRLETTGGRGQRPWGTRRPRGPPAA